MWKAGVRSRSVLVTGDVVRKSASGLERKTAEGRGERAARQLTRTAQAVTASVKTHTFLEI